VDDRSLLQGLLDSPTSHAIVVTDLEGKVTLWNEGAARIFGYASGEIVGQPAAILFVPQDRNNQVPAQEMERARAHGCASDFRWHLRKDGTTFWGDGMVYPVRVAGLHIGYMKLVRDATDEKLREDERERLAFTDALTGLPNRAELFRRLVDMIGTAQRHDELLAFHLIDLDHFKEVNDSLGHQAGDTLLIELAQRMSAHLRSTDLLVRLAGDEFALVQPTAHDVEACLVVAEKLLGELARPVAIGDQLARVSGSIGISLYPVDALDTEQLMANADSALYKAKAAGRGRYCVFEATGSECGPGASGKLRAGAAGNGD
jgi:diguanylate cyclase (GGDEF)-like protein/PAS domain S-box-containing protein